jgi:hypothetical protein
MSEMLVNLSKLWLDDALLAAYAVPFSLGASYLLGKAVTLAKAVTRMRAKIQSPN